MNLWDQLAGDRGGNGFLRHWTGDDYTSTPWVDVVREAERKASALRAAGVEPGTRVATVLTNSLDVVSGILGIWLAGGAVASLPVPARGMELDEYGAQLAKLCAHVSTPMLLVEENLRGALEPFVDNVRTWDGLRPGAAIEPSPPGLDELAFIQYSSGSTNMPKGCMLTPRAIAEQLELLADMSGAVPGQETVCSWLPLSHDMGMFGCVLYSWAWDFDLVLSSPERFMGSPRSWFGDAARFGATQTGGTNSALHFATRAHRRRPVDGDLKKLRVCVIGAERVEWETLRGAIETFGPAGLAPSALTPAYGLAEATLAVSATGLEEPPKMTAVDTVALADGEVVTVEADEPTATRIVTAGRPIRRVNVRLGEPEGLSDIYVSSPSLFAGYYGDPELTNERLQNGEVRTGDVGFFNDGELYIVGRSDDVLSIAGRNVYAREIEAAVGEIAPVRQGCCTIVDVPEDSGARLVMLLELRDSADSADFDEIASTAAQTAVAKAGVDIDECLFLERGALPKTPTGKVQRFRCRELVRSDRLETLAHVPIRATRA